VNQLIGLAGLPKKLVAAVLIIAFFLAFLETLTLINRAVFGPLLWLVIGNVPPIPDSLFTDTLSFMGNWLSLRQDTFKTVPLLLDTDE